MGDDVVQLPGDAGPLAAGGVLDAASRRWPRRAAAVHQRLLAGRGRRPRPGAPPAPARRAPRAAGPASAPPGRSPASASSRERDREQDGRQRGALARAEPVEHEQPGAASPPTVSASKGRATGRRRRSTVDRGAERAQQQAAAAWSPGRAGRAARRTSRPARPRDGAAASPTPTRPRPAASATAGAPVRAAAHAVIVAAGGRRRRPRARATVAVPRAGAYAAVPRAATTGRWLPGVTTTQAPSPYRSGHGSDHRGHATCASASGRPWRSTG